jgi:magnesium transporter
MIRSLIAPQEITDETSQLIRRNVTLEKLEDALTTGEVVWIDIVDPEEKEILWVERMLKLHPNVVTDLRTENGRPTLMVYPKYLFVTLFEPMAQKQEIITSEIHCILGTSFFITVRRSNVKSVQDAYERVAGNITQWRLGEAYFLYLVAQYVIDSYYPLLDRMSIQLNAIEERLMNEDERKKVRERSIYVIKQQLISLRQMVAPQREVLSSMIGEERVAEQAEMRELFRHLYERVLRVYDLIDSQRELCTNVLEMLNSYESQRMVDAVSRLTILSMIFLPLTFITSLFDIGFVDTANPFILPISGNVIFAFVVGAMILSTMTMFWYFRKRQWV